MRCMLWVGLKWIEEIVMMKRSRRDSDEGETERKKLWWRRNWEEKIVMKEKLRRNSDEGGIEEENCDENSWKWYWMKMRKKQVNLKSKRRVQMTVNDGEKVRKYQE